MIKLFEQFNNEQEIREICKEYNIENYTINSDGSIDVDGDVDLSWRGTLERLPLIFNKVKGGFYCNVNKLTSLKGCPKEVGDTFNCSENLLTSLEGCPIKVDGYFDCSENLLTSLEGCPKEVGDTFNCSKNKLTSLKGCPKEVNGDFIFSNNLITYIDYCPNIIEGIFNCDNNNLTSLEGGPMEVKGLNCGNNKITTLKGAPILIGRNLDLYNNPISIIDGSIDVVGSIYIKYTKFDEKIRSLSQDKLKILFDHGVDYNIFNSRGEVNFSRLERLFKDFNI